MQLVEEATEGCWIGHRARMFTSEIGSVYSPPKPDRSSAVPANAKWVETVIDIDHNDLVGIGDPLVCWSDSLFRRVGYSNARKVVYGGFS